MKKMPFHLTLLFIILVFLQIWLFGNIHLFSLATPLAYIYFIIKLPISMNRNIVIVLSALLGFIIDIFSGTLGLNMTITIFTGFFRFYLLKLFASRDIFEDHIPSVSTLGRFSFLKYAGIMTLIQVSLLYLIESLSLFNPLLLSLRIVSSFTLTILLIFAFESINIDVFKK